MPTNSKIKSILICHEDSTFDVEGLSRWLASFSELKGIVILRERNDRKFKRIKREIGRSGLRFLDVLAFRLYYKLFSSRADAKWETGLIERLSSLYPLTPGVPVLVTHSPNSTEAEAFIRGMQSDIVIARCKVILNKRIFSLPMAGTFVMHPGICPEYRNAHGCFWALANGEDDKIGMTLLKVDEGVDTGPIYAYYSYAYDAASESHFKIQTRVVSENLESVAAKLSQIVSGEAEPIDVTGRESGTWGHPWLTKFLAMKLRARRRLQWTQSA